MFTRRTALIGAAMIAAAPFVVKTAGAEEVMDTSAAAPVDLSSLPRRKVKLLKPPFVHPHKQVATGGPAVIEFEMKIMEKEIQVDEDAWLQAMTFNGSVPGPMMVVHEGDYVELTLFNPPENMMQHNIDFHAATGALGGGSLTLVNPGEKAVLRFKATRPGVFVYHCAPGGPMIPWHVVSGMSGCIMVLPRDGLKDHLGNPVSYDRVYYIGENDFYIPRGPDGAYMRFADAGESYADTLAVMNGLIPSHVVFNGRVGALTGDQALEAEQGENVLFVHSQARRSGLGKRQVQQPAGTRSGDLVHPGRIGGGGALHLPAAGRLRLRQPQPDRGSEPWRHGARDRRGHLEQRSDGTGRRPGRIRRPA